MSNKIIYSLLIDTSSNRSIISLNANGNTIEFLRFDENTNGNLSFWLFFSIKQLFEKQSLSPHNLSYISIGTGPGSYTGIRVGAAAAKALCYALNIPLIGFCSLKCYLPPKNGPFFSLLDAKSGGIYMLEGEKNQNSVIYRTRPVLMPTYDASKYLTKSHNIVSPHAEILKEKLLSLTSMEKWFGAAPDGDHLAKFTYFKYENKNFNLSDKLQLLYLRGPNPIAL